MSLTKIANKEALSREDIIEAAYELDGLEKQAADADAYGRQMAHQYVEELVKEAEENGEGEEAPVAPAEPAPAEPVAPAEWEEKTASLEVQNAIAILKKHNVIQ